MVREIRVGTGSMDEGVTKPSTFKIGGRRIGDGHCFVIAEAGVNHDGDPARAVALIDAAVAAGADAVKFQTFKAERVASSSAPKAAYQAAATGGAQSQLDMIRGLELDAGQFRVLKQHCDKRGILFLSTPFDGESVDVLRDLNVAAFKVPSGEITNLALLRHIAAQGRPVILSTGMAFLEEVERAVTTLAEAGVTELAILHCVSNYPAADVDVNLRAMATMAAHFGVPVGYSDHTLGIDVSLAAAALGAAIIEKHFTLDATLPGPDHRASLEPAALAAMVSGIRRIEAALGDGIKRPCLAEEDTRRVARRSLFVDRNLALGETIAPADIVALRPGGGIGAEKLDRVIGRRMKREVAAGDMLAWDDLA